MRAEHLSGRPPNRLVLVLVVGLAIVIVLDTESNLADDAADTAHGFRSCPALDRARRAPA